MFNSPHLFRICLSLSSKIFFKNLKAAFTGWSGAEIPYNTTNINFRAGIPSKEMAPGIMARKIKKPIPEIITTACGEVSSNKKLMISLANSSPSFGNVLGSPHPVLSTLYRSLSCTSMTLHTAKSTKRIQPIP